MTTLTQPEWTRPLLLDKVDQSAYRTHLPSTAQEREALAQRFTLVAIHDLEADLEITKHNAPNHYLLTGHLRSNLIQSCVVTLADVPAQVETDIRVILMPAEEIPEEIDPDMDWIEAEDIEPYTNNMVDLGEIAARYLSISLPPFPRSPEADRVEKERESKQPTEKLSPFSVLSSLKEK